MQRKYSYHLDMLELLGALITRRQAHNTLNKIVVRSDDTRLVQLASQLLDIFETTSTNTLHTTISRMQACRDKAGEIRRHCETQLTQS